MSDYIERDKAIRLASGGCHFANVAAEIAKLPVADVRQNVRGEWEFEYENLDDQIEYCCSCCDWIGVNANEFRFCPNCGAMMDLEG